MWNEAEKSEMPTKFCRRILKEVNQLQNMGSQPVLLLLSAAARNDFLCRYYVIARRLH
jgi:hypothetical protein